MKGEVNPADLFTKHLPSRERVEKLIELFGCEYRGGRAESAPLLRKKEKGGKENGPEEEVHATEDGGREVTVKEEAVQSEDFPWFNEYPTHDPSILPHEYDHADFDLFFPVATAPGALLETEVSDWDLNVPENATFIKHHGATRTRRS